MFVAGGQKVLTKNLAVEIFERVRLVALRHVYEPFSIVVAMLFRAYRAVYHVVVKVRGTVGTRVREIDNLDGRRAMCKYSVAFTSSVRIEVDQDVNAIVSDHLHDE